MRVLCIHAHCISDTFFAADIIAMEKVEGAIGGWVGGWVVMGAELGGSLKICVNGCFRIAVPGDRGFGCVHDGTSDKRTGTIFLGILMVFP